MWICLSRCHQHMTNSVRRRFTSLTSPDLSLCLASAEQKRTDLPRTRSQTRLASGARLLCNSSQRLACDAASWLKLHFGRQFGRVTHLREGPPLRRGRQGWSRVGEIWVNRLVFGQSANSLQNHQTPGVSNPCRILYSFFRAYLHACIMFGAPEPLLHTCQATS